MAYYNALMYRKADIAQVDQSTGERVTVIRNLPCSDPAAFDYRQSRADSVYDMQVMKAQIGIPPIPVREGMRLLLDGEDFRIQSLTKWPRTNGKFITLTLQGDGFG